MVTNIVGDVVFTISLPDGSASREITLSEVAYSPSAPCCLISALLLQDQCGLTADIGSMVLRGADGAKVSPLTNRGGVCMLELRAVQRSFASSPTGTTMEASAALALRRSTRERVLPARLRLPSGAELAAAPARLPTPALPGPVVETSTSTRSMMDRTGAGRLDTTSGLPLPPEDVRRRPPTPTIRPSAPVLAPRGAEARVSAGAAPVGFSDVALSALLNDLDIDPANVTNLCAAAGTALCARSYYGETAMSEVWEDGHFFAIPSKMAVEPVLRKAMLHWTRAPRTTSFTIGVVSDAPLSPSCEKLLERFAVHRDVVRVSPSIRFYVLSASDVVVVSASDHLVLHLTLGHPGHAAIRAFRESGLQVGFPVSADFARVARDVSANCSACRVSKQLRPSAPARMPGLDDAPFRAWMADTKGALMTGVGGAVHAYMMVDQVSGYAIGVAVPDLSGATLTKALDVCMVEINFLAMEAGVWPRSPAEAHTVSVVRILQTDLAKSFTGGEFKARCATLGIAQRFSSPYLHENQATVETAWRPVFNCARAMMVSARVPLTWWPHAFLHAIWLRNGMPRASGVLKGRSPLCALTGKQRDFKRASIFGAPAVVYIDVSRQKEPLVPGEDPAGGRHRQLAQRAKELRYVGNDLRSSSYKLVDVASPSVVQLHGMVKVNEKAGIAASVRGADFWLVPLSMDFDVRMPPEGLLGSAPVGDFTVEGVRVVLHPEDREYYAVIKVCARQDVHTTVTGWVAAHLLLADSVVNVEKVLEYIGRDEVADTLDRFHPILSQVYVSSEALYSDHRKRDSGVVRALVLGVDPASDSALNVQVVGLKAANVTDVPRSSLLVAPAFVDERERAGEDGPASHGLPFMGAVMLLPLEREQSWRFTNRYGRMSAHALMQSGDQVVTLPRTVKQALSGVDAEDWRNEIRLEVSNLVDSGTFGYMRKGDVPPGKTITPCSIKFTHKFEGSVLVRRKVRIVAQGQKQEYGEDYQDVWAPTPQIASIHMVIILALNLGLELHHLDVKAAFLNASIDDYDMYVELPDLPGDLAFPERIAKLLKSIYGLKQAGRDWRKILDALLREMFHLIRSEVDCTVYYLFEGGLVVIIAVFVDDVLTATNSEEWYEAFHTKFHSVYPCKDLGKPSQYVGIEMKRDDPKWGKDTVALSRKGAVQRLLALHGLSDAKPSKTPMASGLMLKRAEQLNPAYEYRALYGSMLYEKRTWCPILAYPLAYFGAFVGHFEEEHYAALKRVLLCVKGMVEEDIPLVFRKKLDFSTGDEFVLEMWADASFADKNATEWQSTSGWTLAINGSPLGSHSKREKWTSLSTTEAELVAFHRGARDLMAAKHLVESIGGLKVKLPMVAYCDNLATIQLLKDAVHNSRTKHIAVPYFWSRQLVEQGLVTVLYVTSERNRADAHTKALQGKSWTRLRNLCMGHAEDAF